MNINTHIHTNAKLNDDILIVAVDNVNANSMLLQIWLFSWY